MGDDEETPWPDEPADDNPFDEPPPPLDEGVLAPVSVEEKSRHDRLVDYLRDNLLTSAQLDDIPEPVAIVGDDFLYADTLNWLVGKPGHGKSFIAIDLAGCVATGTDWHGRPTLQGPVLYIAAEGVRGVKQRVRAWEQEHQIRMTGVDFLPFPVQSTNGSHWDALVALTESRQYVLVVVDTQARVTVGVEENSNKEMGTFVHQAEHLRKAAASCVVLVHHVGSGSDRGRGATTLDGALTTIMKADRESLVVTLSCQKNKDAAEWAPIEFNLMSLGTSAVLRTAQQVPAALVRTVSPDAMRTAKRWFDVYDIQWQAPGALQEATEITRPTFARHRAELERFGYAERMNLGRSQYRYRLTGDPSVPPDERPPAPPEPVVGDPPESPPAAVLEGLE